MPHTSDEELGRRRFQVSRDHAVEAALEKIRHAPAADWHSFSGGDYTLLREILSEIWTGLDRNTWKEFAFSTLTRQDLNDLIDIARATRGHTISRETFEKMEAILSHCHKSTGRP